MSRYPKTKTTSGSSGVVLLSFGTNSYHMAAINLALSIKHYNEEVDIRIFTDSIARFSKVVSFRSHLFNSLIELPELNDKDPALHKLNLYNIVEAHGFDHNICIDVDSICMRDIQPMIDELKSGKDEYLTLVNASYRRSDGEVMPQMVWSKSGKLWQHFKLKDDAVLPAINSSFQYIRKGKLCKKLYDLALNEYSNPIKLDTMEKWGGTQPDELYMNVALCKLGLVPAFNEAMIAPVVGMKIIDPSEIARNYFFMTFFGDKSKAPPRYHEYYDNKMLNMYKKRGMGHFFKISNIFQQKHVR